MVDAANCPSCHSYPATTHPTLGLLPCSGCRTRQSQLPKVGGLPEFTSSAIKQQRKEFANDIVQPFRAGQLSKEYVELYGTKRLGGVSEEEVKKAKYVWNDDRYYNK